MHASKIQSCILLKYTHSDSIQIALKKIDRALSLLYYDSYQLAKVLKYINAMHLNCAF